MVRWDGITKGEIKTRDEVIHIFQFGMLVTYALCRDFDIQV